MLALHPRDHSRSLNLRRRDSWSAAALRFLTEIRKLRAMADDRAFIQRTRQTSTRGRLEELQTLPV
jgi:hypothetical protein